MAGRSSRQGGAVKPVSVGFVALGCAKNTVDLQVMAGHLMKAGLKLAPSPDSADVVIVNTCAFIEAAREEAVSEILRACEMKRAGLCKAVVAAGCFVQRYRDRLRDMFPDVDAFLGIDSLDKVAEIVKGVAQGDASRKVLVPPGQAKRVFDPPVGALRFSGAAFAYLKIAEGCAHRCAYCAIPAIRGPYRSRSLESIVSEARELVETGVKELNVIAQDPMLWGVDLKPRLDLVALLKAIDAIEGDFRVRVLYSYPSEITDAFLEWMNTSPHAVKYIDVPLQHTDPAVLERMARKGAIKATLEAAKRLRAAVPGITLRTTVMTGFPGETEKRFERMLADLKEMAFDHLGAFAFSPEDGTPAAKMGSRPSRAVAEERLSKVMRQQRSIWRGIAKGMVGSVFPALVVAPGRARLESQAPEVDGEVIVGGEAKVGEWVKVRLTKVKGFDFEGTVEND